MEQVVFTNQTQLIQQAIKILLEQLGTADTNGWPIDFFEKTAGSIPDLPERESQGDYETRLEL